jgi:gluconolactonase
MLTGIVQQTDITIFNPEGRRFTNAGFSVLAKGFQFAEGPVWHPDGYLLFSDTPANTIYQLFPDGRLAMVLEHSDFGHDSPDTLSDQLGPNGLALDAQQNLLICHHGDHAIAIHTKDKKLSLLTNTFNGRPFNSPNDIVVASDGIVYFTDPPYGLKDQLLNPEMFQPVAGIYRYDINGVALAATDLYYPNGLAFSPGEEWLYASSTHPEDRKLIRYRNQSGGKLVFDKVIAEESADGICTDNAGNIYLSVEQGILVISPAGDRLALIGLPQWPSNCTWAGSKEDCLLVAAREFIYAISIE